MNRMFFYVFLAFLLSGILMPSYAGSPSDEFKLPDYVSALFGASGVFDNELKLIGESTEPAEKREHINMARAYAQTIQSTMKKVMERKAQTKALPKPAAEVVEKMITALSAADWDFSMVTDMKVSDEDMIKYFHKLRGMLAEAMPTESERRAYREAVSPVSEVGW